ncbi:Methyltransferase domain [Candidatus Nitrososphaera evergladensis SR1]|uniref:Methyltransferase domain n=1 Tax=Candidatus Nitrososphaera evergladensis SR1 TaxID=1459636 RepID=A0A075MRC4_9ARCH|nr:Methyltransferase domain [Candidatus Nitrososphaera evergladensis SR1]
MNIAEFMSTLPENVVRGESVELPEHALLQMFKLAGVKKNDTFFHLGCGQGEAVALAVKKFGVKKAVGVEIDEDAAAKARRKISHLRKNNNAEIVTGDIRDADISGASVVLFWFSDPAIVDAMVKKFRKELKDGARVITIWSPPGMMLPQKVDFPFFVCEKPFKYATSVRQQIKAVYGNKCIDFTAAWLLAERYIDALGVVPGQYRRFVNMLQSMVIWINAWNMGVTCEDGVPPPVNAYLGILREFFGIDMKDLFTRDPKDESMTMMKMPSDDDKMGCC